VISIVSNSKDSANPEWNFKKHMLIKPGQVTFKPVVFIFC